MVVKFNHLLPAMPELGMGLPNAFIGKPILAPDQARSETVKNPDPDSFRPQNQRSRAQNPEQTRPQPPVERGWADKADRRRAVAGGAIGISGMPLTACRRERPPHSDACKQ